MEIDEWETAMDNFALALFILGIIVYLFGGIRLLIAQLSVSFWWFLGGLLFPVVSFVFLCVHFQEAWPPTKICLLGILLLLASALVPELRTIF